MLKVVKFGGSSLADANQFRKVADIIKSDADRKYVVASAPGKRDSHDVKVTDMLLQCFRLVKDKKSIDETFERITERYNGIINDLGLDFSLEEDLKGIKVAILHHASQDYIASRGEYLNSKILAKFLGFQFIDAEEGIFFDENGEFLAEETHKALKARMKEYDNVVLPGFYGAKLDARWKVVGWWPLPAEA